MLSTFYICFWTTTAFAACSVNTRVHYLRADDRSRGGVGDRYNYQERLQSRASSIFGPSGQQGTAAAGFPYRFVFPANHPALNGPVYAQYLQQNSHQSEPLYSVEDLFSSPPSSKHFHQQQHQQQQQQQQQQLGYEPVGKLQYDFFSGGKHHGQSQPYQNSVLIKQPKHYQTYEMAPNLGSIPVNNHQPLYPLAAASVVQPIMLLIPSSGQPGAPYQTLVLVPSAAASTTTPTVASFPGFHHQQIQQFQAPPQFLPGFVNHPRNPPLINSGFPSGQVGSAAGSGLGKYPGSQLFHRSHEPHQQQLLHQQHKPPSSSSLLPTSYQGSGSAHVSHATTVGAAAAQQQPLEEKVSHSLETSGENTNDDRGEPQTKLKEDKSIEFGDKTSTKPPNRIVVT